ncbi:MAG: hypothetical protein FGM54_00950 [Chitinophagaceae bacterium]|nr:hypothetical protein [Chitinophagaceae bacterium]
MKIPNLIFLLIIILSTSCNQLSEENINSKLHDEKNVTNNNADSIKKLNWPDETIIKSIKDYYQINYGKGARLEENRNDSTIEMTYYSIPDNKDDYDGHLIAIWIPLKKNMNLFAANPILEGDLNGDQIDDLILSVHTEGGGGGGNIWWQDLFVYIKENNGYKLMSVSSDKEISGCNGDFRAKEIKNNRLIGNSSCYTDDDPRCCPSLEYKTIIKFENNKLEYVSKERQIPN